jgi:hypothetical protein
MKSIVLAIALASSVASANAFKESGGLLDRTEQTRPQMLSFFLGVPYAFGYYGGLPVSIGARYYIPIAHNGFIPPVNDEFGIEFGADFGFFLGRPVFLPIIGLPVEVMWNFHFTSKFAAYAKLGIALNVSIGERYDLFGGYVGSGIGVYPSLIGGAGIIYSLNDSISLRAEVGYHGLKGGIGITF